MLGSSVGSRLSKVRHKSTDMVFIKVFAGGELRRMQLEGPVSYADLKQKVAQLFPSLQDGKSEFGLQYTDTDGDHIVVSSDAEVQAALDHLPEDHVWRLQVVPVRPIARRGSAQRSRAMAPFGSFGGLGPWFGRELFGDVQMDPFWSPMGLFSSEEDRRHREWENLMKQREEQMDQEMQRLQKMQEDHMRKFEEQRKKAEQDIQTGIQQSRGTKETGATAVAQSGKPNWHCQTFGSWEPVKYESPHGHRTVIGPVGYHMYWGYSDPQEPMDTEGEATAEKTEEDKEKTS